MKYVSMCVTVALLVAALIFSPYHKSTVTDVTVGKGKGISEPLENLEDVVDFLDFLSGSTGGESLSYSTQGGKSLSSVNDAGFSVSPLAAETIPNKSAQKKYTSGTWHEDALVKISAQEQGGDYYSFSLSRRLSGYMTTTSSYYVSKGNISASTGENCIFDVEVYKDTVHSLIKINQFDGLYENLSDEVTLSAEFFGTWFDMGEFSDIMDIDMMNRQYLSEFQVFLEECCFADSKQLSQMGVERIDGKGKVRLLSEDMEMVVDMKQEKNPTIHISSGHVSNSSSMKEQTTMELSYRFENINNTVVALDPKIEIHNIEDYMKEMK